MYVRTYTIPYRRAEKNQKSDKKEIEVLTALYIRNNNEHQHKQTAKRRFPELSRKFDQEL